MKRFILPLILPLLISCHSDKPKDNVEITNPYEKKAWGFYSENILDSSFIYYNKAKEIYLKKADTFKAVNCLINMAIISGKQGDYFGSQELSVSAISYLDAKNEEQRETLSSAYNNLGKIAFNLKKYDEASQFYLTAIQLTKDKDSKYIYLNNIAINLSHQKKYKEAISYFEDLLLDESTKSSPLNFARILSNTSKTKWLQNSSYDPIPEFNQALKIRIRENDLFGQNASFAHIADYYTNKQTDSALHYANKMYQVARQLMSSDDQVEALQKLIKLSPNKESKYYFEIYQQLNDSIQVVRGTAKNQFAFIKYETEKHKADNLELLKDNTEKKYQIFILIFSTVLLLVAGTFWYKKRKQRLELEAQNSIRENQLKTSKKVHDVVANGLYRVMTEIENQEDINRDHILDKIEDMYEKSRDISYDQPQLADQHFHKKLDNLLQSFNTELTEVAFVGNTADLWRKVSIPVKYEIEHILQELMVNMKKHSSASNINILFKQENNQISIDYTDNGIGLPKDIQFKNGLSNTENRIKNISGTITFDTKVEKGLAIHISFPIS